MLPRVVLHNAVSVDGRMDHLTPDIGLFYQLISKWKEDATLTGSDTILRAYTREQIKRADAEASSPRKSDPKDKRPLLVVPDSRGRLRCWNLLRREPYWRNVVALCSRKTPQKYLNYLQRQQVDVIRTGTDHVNLAQALKELRSRYKINIVRADCGGALNGALLRAGLVDEVSLLVHPCLIGGSSSASMFRAPDLNGPKGVIRLKLTHLRKLRDGIVWMRYKILKNRKN